MQEITTKESWLSNCASTTNYKYGTQATYEYGCILHLSTSTSLKRPTGQRAVWGSSDPVELSYSLQAAKSTKFWTRL